MDTTKKMEFKNGAVAEIHMASMREATNLKSSLQQAIKESNCSEDLFSVLADGIGDVGINKVFDIFMTLDSNPLVFDSIMGCLARCLYNGEKITEFTFSTSKARENYYKIVVEMIKINLLPFFNGVASVLSEELIQDDSKPQNLK